MKAQAEEVLSSLSEDISITEMQIEVFEELRVILSLCPKFKHNFSQALYPLAINWYLLT
jgi:hypothetical protein